MELRYIKAFITLAETLNFSRAAETLFVSQSTLSRQISALEDDLGVKLLERDTRSVRLTDAGKRFLAEARKSLTHLNSAVEAAVSCRSAPEKCLTIGYDKNIDLNSGLMSNVIKPLCMFKRDFPDVDVQIAAYDSNQLYGSIQRENLDVAIMIHEVGNSWDQNAVFGATMILCDYMLFLLPYRDRVDFNRTPLRELLEPYDTVFAPNTQNTYSTASAIFNILGIFPYIQFCDSWMSSLLRVSAGKGYTFCPTIQAHNIDIPGIVAVHQSCIDLQLDVVAYWKKNTDNINVHAFLDYIDQPDQCAGNAYTPAMQNLPLI